MITNNNTNNYTHVYTLHNSCLFRPKYNSKNEILERLIARNQLVCVKWLNVVDGTIYLSIIIL